jgi:hypothetical protein
MIGRGDVTKATGGVVIESVGSGGRTVADLALRAGKRIDTGEEIVV